MCQWLRHILLLPDMETFQVQTLVNNYTLLMVSACAEMKEGLRKHTPTLSTEPVVEMVRLTMPLTTIRTTSRSITMRFTTQVEKTAPRWDNYTILWLRNNTLQTVLLNMNLQCKRDETEEGQSCAVIISKVWSQRNTIFLLRKALLKMPNLQYVGVQDQLYDSCR